MNTIILMIIMSITTYLIRMIPFVSFRKKITNKYIKSLLYYMPYAILSAMTIPAILYTTGNIKTALPGLIVGLLLSLKDCSLTTISLATCLTSLLSWLIIR